MCWSVTIMCRGVGNVRLKASGPSVADARWLLASLATSCHGDGGGGDCRMLVWGANGSQIVAFSSKWWDLQVSCRCCWWDKGGQNRNIVSPTVVSVKLVVFILSAAWMLSPKLKPRSGRHPFSTVLRHFIAQSEAVRATIGPKAIQAGVYQGSLISLSRFLRVTSSISAGNGSLQTADTMRQAHLRLKQVKRTKSSPKKAPRGCFQAAPKTGHFEY